ncbi:MAG: sulfurtransferase [Anaerolineae bacterium]|nr:sulfurtransferase [Anaerolineae bacterium]
MSAVSTGIRELVSTDWVAENLNTPGVRLVEIDVETSTYAEKGHLPGAVAFNWTSQLQDQELRDIISQENFEALLSEAGISKDDHVVIYGDNNNWFAAYAFWLFKYYNHENVSLMNGGRKRWELDGRDFVSDVPAYPRSNYKVDKINKEFRADRDYILPRLGKNGFGLVDVRSPDEYTGKVLAPPGLTETAQRGGHIPGASNIPWAKAVNEDGTYKSAEELRALYRAEGIDENADEIVAYCRIGERSSHSWFALKYLLGYKNVRNYDGSWTEWGNLIGNPIRKGPEK